MKESDKESIENGRKKKEDSKGKDVGSLYRKQNREKRRESLLIMEGKETKGSFQRVEEKWSLRAMREAENGRK